MERLRPDQLRNPKAAEQAGRPDRRPERENDLVECAAKELQTVTVLEYEPVAQEQAVRDHDAQWADEKRQMSTMELAQEEVGDRQSDHDHDEQEQHE